MEQSVAICPAAGDHSQFHILLIADGTHVVGPPETVILVYLLRLQQRVVFIGSRPPKV
jgi:hypothetical protein